jgi:hypothetical protein
MAINDRGSNMRMNFVAIVLAGVWAASSPALAQQKTVKACQAEWQANKAENQAKGVTEKAYVDVCRSGTVTTQPTATPAAAKPAPTIAAPAPAPNAAAPRPVIKPAANAPLGANQFPLEAQAKARCPADSVVWVNMKSKIYHFSGHKDYGTTKEGAYMCEKDATAQGIRAAKNEKHPA